LWGRCGRWGLCGRWGQVWLAILVCMEGLEGLAMLMMLAGLVRLIRLAMLGPVTGAGGPVGTGEARRRGQRRAGERVG
jgi:hypothetical protein